MLFVIAGVGRHSKGGPALPSAVKNFLLANGYSPSPSLKQFLFFIFLNPASFSTSYTVPLKGKSLWGDHTSDHVDSAAVLKPSCITHEHWRKLSAGEIDKLQR